MKTLLNTLLSLLCALFWLSLMLSFSDVQMTLMTLLAAIAHELGHIVTMICLKKDFLLPRSVASGFRIKSLSQSSYKEEIIIAISGPLINLLFFAVFIGMSPTFAIINLVTAATNLLPMKDFDGYKIISDLISVFFGCEASDKIMPHLTVAVSSLFVFLSLFMIMIFNGGYWIFFIFFIVLVRQILFLQKHTFFEH